ncbi:MAG: hypothetical protein R2830_04355 [Saprospiraceae bacterium]
MKIGLLECDHVLPKFRPIAGDYSDMFRALFPALELVNYDVCNGHFPASPHECDGYLVTGSKHSVYDEVDWILELKAFVKAIYESGRTYVGVCFGHQMLGEALGGKVEKAKTGWHVGVHSFDVTAKEDWMKPPLEQFNLLMSCQDQVVKLPENSVVLAKTPTCPVAMFRVGENMLGIQAHPEFPKPYARALLESRRERIGAELVEAALKRFDLPLTDRVVAQWIVRFLEK